MAKLFRKGKVQKIVAIVLGLVTIAGAVFGVSALAKYAKEEQKTIKPAFSVGGLTEAGVYEETDDMIYTKDAFEAKGLEIKLDFDSNVKYQVFFYDELDKFISCTEVYTESQDVVVPLDSRARLEVTPIWGADAPLEKQIKWYETAKYANQLEIRVDKRQELLESDFASYKLTDTTMFKADYEHNMFLSASTGELVFSENQEGTLACYFTYDVEAELEKMYVEFDSRFIGHFWCFIVDENGIIEKYDGEQMANVKLDNAFTLRQGYTVYFSFSTLSEDTIQDMDVRIYIM